MRMRSCGHWFSQSRDRSQKNRLQTLGCDGGGETIYAMSHHERVLRLESGNARWMHVAWRSPSFQNDFKPSIALPYGTAANSTQRTASRRNAYTTQSRYSEHCRHWAPRQNSLNRRRRGTRRRTCWTRRSTRGACERHKLSRYHTNEVPNSGGQTLGARFTSGRNVTQIRPRSPWMTTLLYCIVCSHMPS